MKRSRFSSIRHIAAACAMVAGFGMSPIALAQRQEPAPEGALGSRDGLHQPLAQVALEHPIVTRHVGTFNGKKVAYTATVEPITVTDAADRPAAKLLVISYSVDHPAATRPVLFAFNGGPIAESGTIHFGFLGPKRISIPDDLKADPSTFKMVDNGYSLLDVADLVFFDPAETGYSRALPGVDFNTAFTSVSTDARELTSLVMQWCKIHDRRGAPKYLVGESYGTMRAAESANQLMKAGMPPAGVVLLGQAVNIIEYAQRPDNIVSYAISLPPLAATGWFHDKAERRGRTFEQFMLEAEDYGAGEYLSVLFLGQRAPPRPAASGRAETSGVHRLTGGLLSATQPEGLKDALSKITPAGSDLGYERCALRLSHRPARSLRCGVPRLVRDVPGLPAS